MKEILIGSAAIIKHFPDFPRTPKDLDYIVTDKNFNWSITDGGKRIEYLVNPVFAGYDLNILSPNDLYTLKISHIFWDIKWEKHMFDVQWLKKKGCVLNRELFDRLYAFWNEYHGKNKRSNLQMSAADFFDNNVGCEHSHDWLHTLLKDPPTYTKVLKDGAEVEVCENKFNNLSFDEKCDLVREEVMVMAAERFKGLDYRHRYTRMMKKFIQGHAPIFEALFIVENYILLHVPTFNFIEHINKQLVEKNLPPLQ